MLEVSNASRGMKLRHDRDDIPLCDCDEYPGIILSVVNAASKAFPGTSPSAQAKNGPR